MEETRWKKRISKKSKNNILETQENFDNPSRDLNKMNQKINNVYDKKSFLQKFENSFVSKIKANMSVELKKTTQAFVGSIVGIMFSEFEGK